MESGKYKSGTTLIEMLTVVAVIMLLAGMVLGIAAGIDNQSKEKAVKATFELLESALQEYYDFRGVFPLAADANPNVNCEILYAELNSLPGSREVLEQISDKLIRNNFNPGAAVPEIYDPWGTVLDYRYDAVVDSFPKLISAGPDKDMAATGDNITNR
jgi:type II secretory pathway pseudopilin PulG